MERHMESLVSEEGDEGGLRGLRCCLLVRSYHGSLMTVDELVAGGELGAGGAPQAWV